MFAAHWDWDMSMTDAKFWDSEPVPKEHVCGPSHQIVLKVRGTDQAC